MILIWKINSHQIINTFRIKLYIPIKIYNETLSVTTFTTLNIADDEISINSCVLLVQIDIPIYCHYGCNSISFGKRLSPK